MTPTTRVNSFTCPKSFDFYRLSRVPSLCSLRLLNEEPTSSIQSHLCQPCGLDRNVARFCSAYPLERLTPRARSASSARTYLSLLLPQCHAPGVPRAPRSVSSCLSLGLAAASLSSSSIPDVQRRRRRRACFRLVPLTTPRSPAESRRHFTSSMSSTPPRT